MNNNLKAVAYDGTAKSTRGKRSVDLENQALKIERYAKEHGITVVKDFEHTGNGYSHLVNIFDYCINENVKTMLVTDQDVISRDYAQALYLIVGFEKYGIKVIPVDMIDREDFKNTLWYRYTFAEEGEFQVEDSDEEPEHSIIPF